MSTDRELLELAAKAAGIRYHPNRGCRVTGIGATDIRLLEPWNPLADDGDALRLAVKLRLDISPQPDDKIEVSNQWENEDDFRWAWESYGGDAFAATRRAIVRAAAEIGKAMP